MTVAKMERSPLTMIETMQKELVNRYEQINEIKTELSQRIIPLTDITTN